MVGGCDAVGDAIAPINQESALGANVEPSSRMQRLKLDYSSGVQRERDRDRRRKRMFGNGTEDRKANEAHKVATTREDKLETRLECR